jgi:S1-C subfamily serine protease
MPRDPFTWPWNRGGMFAALTLLPPGADREQPDVLPRISRVSSGNKTIVMTEGTGFFISVDGTIMTAAHLLKNCPATIQVTSRYLPQTVATRVAFDTDIDVAMIRTTVIPPGILGLAPPPVGYARLTVLGFPTEGELTPASEVRGSPLRDVDSTQPEHPLQVMRIDAELVRPGFSGGPILSPDGDVIGMVRASIVVRASGRLDHTTPTGIVVGPGSGAIAGFIGRVAPGLRMIDVKARHGRWEDMQEVARRATVRVFCAR